MSGNEQDAIRSIDAAPAGELAHKIFLLTMILAVLSFAVVAVYVLM